MLVKKMLELSHSTYWIWIIQRSLMVWMISTPPWSSLPFFFPWKWQIYLWQATTLRLIHMDLHQGVPTGSTLEALPTAGTLLTRDLTLFTRSLQVHCARIDTSKSWTKRVVECNFWWLVKVALLQCDTWKFLEKLMGLFFHGSLLQLILDMSFSNKIDETLLHSQSSTKLRQQYPASSCCPWPQDMGCLRCVAMVGLVPGERLILVRSKRNQTCLKFKAPLSPI